MSVALISVADDDGLAGLAATANEEHRLVLETGTTMIDHALRAGAALLTAKKLVPYGAWMQWCLDNLEISENWASKYMRLARHRDIVLARQPSSIKGALGLLHTAPDSRVDPGLREEARQLQADGKNSEQIAAILRVSKTTAYRWCHPLAESRYRERHAKRTKAARLAWQRQERDAAVRRVGGSVAEAYALVRRALQELDRAADAEHDKAAKRAIHSAITRLHNAEDQIVAAVRLTRPKEAAA